jgi:hypothetical protein
MHKVLKELLDNGVSFEISKDENRESYVYEITGFYKSNFVKLREKDSDTLEATCRYNETETITSFDDLVRLNYRWWDYSKDRFDGWASPEGDYMKHFKRLGLV